MGLLPTPFFFPLHNLNDAEESVDAIKFRRVCSSNLKCHQMTIPSNLTAFLFGLVRMVNDTAIYALYIE